MSLPHEIPEDDLRLLSWLFSSPYFLLSGDHRRDERFVPPSVPPLSAMHGVRLSHLH